MAYSAALRDRIAAAIIDGAAQVLVAQGAEASMADIADAAGVGRATLYRYFPNRDTLLRALAAVALEETCSRLADADLERVPVAEGIERVARALLDARTKYAVLIDDHKQLHAEEAKARLGESVRALLRRGLADGTLDQARSEDELMAVFGGLLHAVAHLQAAGGGTEKAAQLVGSVFLHGTAAAG